MALRSSDAAGRWRRRRWMCATCVAAWFGGAPFAHAIDYTWTGAESEAWAMAANWSPATDYPRAPGDRAIFTGATVRACTFTGTATIDELRIDASFPHTLTIGGGARIAAEADDPARGPAADILTVTGPIVNGGRIVEAAPAHIHHAADALDASNAALSPIVQVAAGSGFRVRLRDGDEALNAATIDSAAGLTIRNTRNGDMLTRTATETAANSGVFATTSIGTEAVPDASADNFLQAIPGDVIAITYRDNEDPADVREAFLSIAPDTARTVGFFVR